MVTALLNEEITAQLKEVFEKLQEPVEILFFGSKKGCEYCDETLQLATEVTALSDRLGLQTFDIDEDPETARQYRVDKAPTMVIAGRDGDRIVDYGIRLSGIPSGHEFSTFVHDLVLVSRRDSDLSETTREFLRGLEKPVLLQVFVTPTCPYCPRAVYLVHQMALESPMVEAEMVEAMEFPVLADRFGVSGVPQTTINSGAGTVVGAVPEDYLVAEIQRAIAA